MSISADGIGIASAGARELAITEADIARLKSVLKLTPEQERHWRPVAAALRALVHSRGQDEGSEASLVQRVQARVAGYVLDAGLLARLSSVARPLIASLDESQKQDGLTAIRSMGIASLP